MANIAQKQLFGYEDIKNCDDLEDFSLILENLPDEELMQKLEKERGYGRDDYPVRVLWNAIIAGVIFQHPSIQSLIRELRRNAQLRQLCGFDVCKGLSAVPKSWNFSRFLKNVIKHQTEIELMFNKLVASISEHLSDFGEVQAIDGKALASYAKGKAKEVDKSPDGRRDTDANWAKKVYKGNREDGSPWEKVVKWFGYRLHLVVDAKYELPITYEVTKAADAEIKIAHQLLEKEAKEHPELLKRCRFWLGDRGYDDGKYLKALWDEHEIKPVIDIRNCWKDGEKTKPVSGYKNIIYDYQGEVSCVCLQTNKDYKMAYAGFEKDRMTLKYRCPARQYGITCESYKNCPSKSGIRIPLEEDRRIFLPLARSSYKWHNEYKKRTSVERVNSRIDNVFCFENHFIRGLKKMKLRIGIMLCVMLALALGRIKQNEENRMCNLCNSA